MAESLYPQMIDKFDRKRNETGAQDGDYVMAEDVNELQSAIEKIQSTIGVNPQGGHSTIAQRLSNIGSSEVMSIPNITFFSGNPLYANGITNEKQLIKAFGWFSHVILSDYDPEESDDVSQVKSLIEKTYSQEEVNFYMPIDADRNSSFDMLSVDRRIKAWIRELGIKGAYIYNAGYDKQNTRNNQNELIDVVKANGLNVMMTASNLLDLTNSHIHHMNPEQESISLTSDDIILDNDFGKSNSVYHSSSHVDERHNSILKIKKEVGCKTFAVSHIDNATSNGFAQDYFYLNSLAMLISFDAFYVEDINKVQHELCIYPKIPLTIGYYDENAEVQKRGTTWTRYDEFGQLSVDIMNHTFDYSGIKIPMGMIEIGQEKIPWANIDLTNMDFDYDANKMVSSINDMGDYLGKIKGQRIDYKDVGVQLIQSLNRYPDLLNEGEMMVKISSSLVEGISLEEILAKVSSHFKELFGEMLQDYLTNGWLDANFNSVFANFIEATNAYFENVVANNIEAKGLNAGIIKTGKLQGGLIDTGTITGDKVTFLNSMGLNKWYGTIAYHSVLDDISDAKLKPEILNGIRDVRNVEAVDSNIISTTDSAGALENYVVVWETCVLSNEPYQTTIHFSASDKASLYVNGQPAKNLSGNPVVSSNMIAVPYTLKLNRGWNKIQVVQSHTVDTSVSFNIGICLGEESKKNELDPGTSPILRVDAYAEKSTSISGDKIETNTITAKQIDVDNLTAEIVKTSLIEAMEAHIKTIIAEDGQFETLLSDLLKAQTIDTSNIRIVSEAKDENGNYGILLIDQGGMTLSSAPRAIKPALPDVPAWELLTRVDDGIYAGSKEDWVYLSSDKYARVKLIDQFDNEFVLDTIYYTVDYVNGKVSIDYRKLMTEENIDITVYNKVYGNYYWYDLEFPQDAQVIRINRQGVWISPDGGRTYKSKLTGNGLVVETIDITDQAITGEKVANLAIENAHIKDATIESAKIKTMDAGKITFGMLDLEAVDPETGKTVQIATSGKCVTIDKNGVVAVDDNLNPQAMVKLDQGGLFISEDGGTTWKSKLTGNGLVVENAEIENLDAGKITTGSLNADTTISVASKVFIDGKEGIVLKDGLGNSKILINENINISEGKLSVSEKGTERITLGNINGAYGLKLFTNGSYIMLDKDGLRTSNGNFNIDKDGNVILKGKIEANQGYFGTDTNKILIDNNGLTLGTGSIVDTRDVANQKLSLSTEGIVAKRGKIGSVTITDAGLETNGAIIGPEIIVTGEENIQLHEGSIVIRKGTETLMAFGNLSKHLTAGYYGIYTDLYDEVSKTGATITWNQFGLIAKQGNDTVFSINDRGNLFLKGNITATSGYLQNLDITGTLTIKPSGYIVAGNTTLNQNGIVANQGTIGGWSISQTGITSGTLSLKGTGEITAPGFTLNSAGITSTTGVIGGWTIGAQALTAGNVSINSTTEQISIKDQILLGKLDATNYGLRAGTVILNANGLTGTNFSLGVNGMTSTKGVIAGWTINTSTITSGNIKLDSSANKISIGTSIELNNDGTAKIGNILFNNTVDTIQYGIHTPNFKIDSLGNVTMTGAVNATSGKFQGRIEAAEGWFGNSTTGVNINQYGLSAGSVLLNNNGLVLTTSSGSISLSSTGLLINETSPTFATSINLNNKFIADYNGLTASAGRIANWIIASNTLTSGGIVIDSSLEQIKVGTDITIGKISGAYKIKIGNYTTLDSTGLYTTKGTIGSWTIDSQGLSSGAMLITPNEIKIAATIDLKSDGSAKLGALNVKTTGDIYSGTSEVLANFKVSNDGTIEAKKGKIANWNISETELSGTAIELLPTGAITVGTNNEVVIDSQLGIDVAMGTTTIDLEGNLTTQKLNATAGKIGDWSITNGKLASNNETITLDSANDVITTINDLGRITAKIGKFTYNDADLHGLWAQDGVIAGWLVAETGFSIPGITLESKPIPQIRINETVFLKGDGNVILNAQTDFKPDGSAKVGQLLISADGSIKNINENFIITKEGNVKLVGDITAATGNIGGWLIQDKQLTSSNVTLRADGINSYIGIGSNIKLNNDGTAKLGSLNVLSTGLEMVDKDGIKALTFNRETGSLNITGSITSNTGNIGGWNIDADAITSPEIVEGRVIKLYSGASSSIMIGGTTETIAPVWFRNDGVGKIGILQLNKSVDNVNYTLYSDNFKIDNQGNGYFNGSIYTNQGEVAGWKVSGSKIYVTSSIVGDESELGLDAYEKRFYVTNSLGDLVLTVDGDDGINVNNKFTVDTAGNLLAKSGNFGLSATDGVKINNNGLEVYGVNGKIIAGDAVLSNKGLALTGVNSSITLGASSEFSVTGAGHLTSKSGVIGGWNIGASKLSSSNVSIDSLGKIELGLNKELVLNSTLGITTANTQIDLTGKITTDHIEADGGIIAGWNIQPGSLSTPKVVIDATNERIVLGTNILKGDNSGNIGSLNIATDGSISSKNNSFTIDGTTGSASFTGSIISSSGNIAGWLINSTELKDSLNKISLSPTTGIKVGGTSFTVDLTGLMKATAGRFGSSTNYVEIDTEGLNIVTGKLKAGSVTLSSAGVTAGLVTMDGTGITAPGFALSNTGLSLTQGQIVLPGVTINENGLVMAAGSVTLGSGKFIAASDGRVTATYGTIGGWALATNKISAGTISLDSTTGSESIKIGTNIAFNQNGSATIGALSITSTGAISSKNNSFLIDGATGNATFSGNLSATTGTIGGWAISATKLTSSNISLNNDGTIVIGDPLVNPIIIDSDLGIIMDNTSIELDGTINTSSIVASGGKIANLVIANNKLTAGNITIDSTLNSEKITIGTNIALNNNGSAKLGAVNIASTGAINTTNNNLVIDATGNVSLNGSVTSNSGNIGGWAITNGVLSSGNVQLVSTTGSQKISIGSNIALNNDGSAKIGNLTVDTLGNATLTGAITSSAGNIGGWAIGADSLTSNGIGIYSGANARIDLASNVVLRKDGTAKIGTLNVSATGSITSKDNLFVIDGTTGSVSLNGSITSTSGNIGGWTIASGGLTSTGISILSGATPSIQVGSTIILNSTGAATIGKLSIGTDGSVNSTNGKFTIDASGNLSINGSITSGAGTIAGWTLSSNTLSSNGITLTSGASSSIKLGTGITLNNDGTASIGLLNVLSNSINVTANSTKVFEVTSAGAASFTGAITTASGNIGGWRIISDHIESASNYGVGLYSNGSIKIGNGSAWKVAFDSTGINVNSGKFIVNSEGVVTATAGYFGDTTNGVQLSNGKLSIIGTGSVESSDGSVKISRDGIAISKGSISLGANFTLTDTGVITANSGTIAGWSLLSNVLTSANGNVKLDSALNKITLTGVGGTTTLSNSGINTNNNFIVTDAGSVTAKIGYLGDSTNGVEISSAGLTVKGTGSIKTSRISLVDKTLTINDGVSTHLTLGEYVEDTTSYYGLKSTGFTLDSRGLNLSSLSNININNKFKVDNLGNLIATNVNLTGAITATSGTFTGTVNATAGKFGSATNYVTVDSLGLTTDNGRIKAGQVVLDTNGITAPGFTLGTSGLSLTQGTITLTGVTINASGLAMTTGSINLGSGKFIATNTGSVTAKLGYIGNWVISDNNLKSANGNVNFDSVNNRIEIYKDSAFTTKDKVVIEAGAVKIINSNGVASTAMDSAGIYGQLITSQSIGADKFDQIAPSKVTGLSATSYSVMTINGEESGINLTWIATTTNSDATTCTDLAGYKVYLKDITNGDADFYPVLIAYTNKCQLRNLRANAQYDIKIEAYDKVGNTGVISDALRYTVAKDTTPPSKVVISKVTTGFKSLGLFWNPCTEVDLNYYEIERKQKAPIDSVWSAFTLISKSNNTSLIDSDLDYDLQYVYRIRGVDLSGNNGTYSNETTTMQPSRIGKTDIVAGTITAEELNIGSVVKSINVQNTTLFHFDGTLMSSQGRTPYVEVLENGTKVPHQEGFFRKEARFGASASMEEATTNLVAVATENNANFRDNIRGWNLSANAQYIDHDGVDGVDDGFLRVSYDWYTFVEIDVDNSATEDVYYTVSMYSKSENNHLARVDIRPMDGDSNIWLANYPTFASGYAKNIISTPTTKEWGRYSGTFFIPANSGTTKIRIVLLSSGVGHTPDIDNVQVEKRRFATSFVNGSKGLGYIDYENNNLIKPDKGVISLWLYNNIGWKTSSPNMNNSTVDNLFIIGKPATGYDVDANSLYAKYDRGNHMLSFKYNGQWSTYIFGNDIADKQWIHIVYSWKNAEQVLYINGKEVSRKTANAITSFSDSLFRIGYMPRLNTTTGEIIEEHETSEVSYMSRANCLFDELRIDKEMVNVEETKSWFLQESSFYDAASQIDADSQNISAANASVVINNEGITVKDGKIDVSSQDGQVLITGGRLIVNGLDVGVAQSDNNVYNGNFTIEDSIYGLGDLKQTIRGVEQFGAKYWKTRRSNPQKYENAYLSVSWNSMKINSIFDDKLIWNIIENMVYLEAVKTYFNVTEVQFNPIASFYPWTLAPAGTPTKLFLDALNVAYTQYAPVKSAMIKLVTEYIALNAMAYHLGQELSTNEEDTQVLRAFITSLVDVYYDHQWTNGTSTAPFGYKQGGVPSDLMKPAYVELILQTIIALSSQARYGLISSIYDTTKLKYDTLVNFKIGIMQWNDAEGTPKVKAFTIMTKEYMDNVFKPAYPSATLIENALYEVKNTAIDRFVMGFSMDEISFEEVLTEIDLKTGLPVVDFNSVILPGDGGTYFHSAINSHYLGRYGYAELGVEGEESNWVDLQQDVSRLVCYTDGMQPDGTHFKQNNFSMNYVWDRDENGISKKSDGSRLKFEIEEMIPRFTVVDNKAHVMPSYTFEMREESYYDSFHDPMLGGVSRIQAYYQYLQLVNPAQAQSIMLGLTHEDKCLIHNTVLDQSLDLIQAMEAGHSEYVNGKYKICSARNIKTIALPDDAKYIHAGTKMEGTIVNGTCYFLEDEQGNPDLGPELTLSNGTVVNKYTPVFKLMDYSTKPGWINNVTSNSWVAGTLKKGDEVSVMWNGNFEVDAKIEAPHGPDHGTLDILINRAQYQVATINNPNYSMQKMYDVNGFYSGLVMLTVVNRGQIWVDAPQSDTDAIFTGIHQMRMYDYHSIKDYLGYTNPSLVNQIDWDGNTVEVEDNTSDAWKPVYMIPTIANSKVNGVPILPEYTPVKYKVKVKLEKDATQVSQTNLYNNMAYCKVTGVQAELGKNPSYHRLSYGDGSVSGIQLQSYNKMFWSLSGVKTRHLEDHMPGYHRETGIYTRHVAERAITSSKVAYEAIKNDNLANNNISYNKVRLQKKIFTNHTCSLTDFANWHYGGDDRAMVDCFELRPTQVPQANKYFILDAIEYNSEMIYENGQLLYEEDYSIKKKLGTCSIRDLSLVAGLYGKNVYSINPADGSKVYPYPLLKNLYDTNARRPLTQDELTQFLVAVELTDLYDEIDLDNSIKESEAIVYEITEIQLNNEPDQSDKYLITYWVEP